MDNPLAASPAGAPDPSQHPLSQALGTSHGMAQAMFETTGKSLRTLASVSKVLDSLAEKGDTVTPDDVVDGAGKLVGSGLAPAALAGLLADMPTSGGPAISAWLQQQAEQVAQREAQAQQNHAVARHEMTVSGLRLLAAHSQQAQPQPPMQPAVPSASLAMEGPSGAN